jgi:hypothetical protein
MDKEKDFSKVIARILKYYEKYRRTMTNQEHNDFLKFYQSVETLMYDVDIYPFEYLEQQEAYTHFFLMCELGKWDGAVRKK